MGSVIERVAQALCSAKLSGWLFYNIYHRDHVADTILGVPENAINTRPWACLILADGTVKRVVHAIEEKILEHLPGTSVCYRSRNEFIKTLTAMLLGKQSVAVNYSDTIPALSLVDHGFVLLLQQLAIPTIPAENLIQRVLGVLDSGARKSHRRAAISVRTVLNMTWNRLSECLLRNNVTHEGKVRDWILDGFQRYGLVCHEPPLVAVGQNSSDPHYQPIGVADSISLNQLVQFDLWAKEPQSGAIYADISWVGYTGFVVPKDIVNCFKGVSRARDSAVTLIRDCLSKGVPITGAEVDQHTRRVLQSDELLSYVRHRTGHAIDTRLHGIGVNLDTVEFPDPRPIIDGSCFSIEPGVYLPEYGVRSEINAYVQGTDLVISGRRPQQKVLSF